jgi:hypothetical protein
MHAIHFCPVSCELFLVDAPTPEAAAAPSLIARLRALGWPARARLASAKAPQTAAAVSGMLVELIDALPILAQTPAGDADGAALAWVPSLAAWQSAARLALELVRRGRMKIRLTQRGSGFEARWGVLPQTPAERAAMLRIAADFAPVIAVPEEARGWAAMRGGAVAERAPLPAPRLLQRFLDACADTLVREASRRGALVRLKGWPAPSWEQRLVRALGEDRARFFWDPEEAPGLASEVNAWAEDQAAAATLSLLPSPGQWAAPETLASVLRRLTLPAARLAETLSSGRAAPRMLRHTAPARLAAAA